MTDTEIKKNTKVWVTFGPGEKLQGVVIDVYTAKNGQKSYLVMFKSIHDVENSGWYDCDRVFRL